MAQYKPITEADLAPPAPSGGGSYKPISVDQLAIQPRRGPLRPGVGAPPPARHRSLVPGFANTAIAAMQRTSPVITTLTGEQNYERLGDAIETDSGPMLRISEGQWLPIDPKQHVILLDPETNKPAVYARNPKMEASAGTSFGRLLGLALTNPVSKLAGGTAAAARVAGAAPQLAQDFEKVGVAASLPALTQSPWLMRAQEWLKTIPGAGGAINAGVERQMAQTGAAASKVAEGYGTAQLPRQVGAGVQSGVERFASSAEPGVPTASAETMRTLPTRAVTFGDKAASLYAKLDEYIPPTTTWRLRNTKAALTGPMNRFPTSPEMGKFLTNPQFRRVSQILEKSGDSVTWAEIQQLRSHFGQMLKDPALRSGLSRADVERVYMALSEDMGNIAKAMGPQAEKAFSQAVGYYNAGMKRINGSLAKFWNADSPEKAYQAVLNAASKSASRADINKLYALRRSLSNEEWGDVASTILRQAGQPIASEVDALQPGAFSASRFMTTLGGMSNEARDLLFSATGSKGTRDALQSLMRVVSAEKNVERLRNTSNTAAGVVGPGTMVAFFHAPVSTTLALIPANGAARLMFNPGFVRWLGGMSQVRDRGQLTAALARLDFVARQSPEIADDLRNFAAQLENQFGAQLPAGQAATPQSPRRQPR